MVRQPLLPLAQNNSNHALKVRSALRAKTSRALARSSITAANYPARPSVIQHTKKDKRIVRHNALLSRVTASASITKTSKKNAKRKESRDQKKNLTTNLESLADALPSAQDEGDWEDLDHAILGSSSKEAIWSRQDGKIKMRSIKSRPGAQKRKEKMLREECVRFGKNLAIINTAVAQKGQEQARPAEIAQPAINPWAALRGFIASTMEKKEEFVQMEATKTAGANGTMEVDT